MSPFSRGKDKDKPKSESGGDGNDGRDGGNITGDGDCKKMVLKMDCSGYPTDKAPLFALDESPQTLKISELKRCERNAAGKDLYTFFKDDNEAAGLPENTAAFLKERFGLSDAAVTNGKTALKALKDAGETINLHHILPGWAGGSDHGSNLSPVSSSRSSGPSDHKQVHDWWSNKTKSGRDKLVKQAEACADKAKKQAKKDKKQPDKSADSASCLKNKDMSYKALAECQLTNIAKCLDDKGVKFQLEITCPNAVDK